MMALNENASSVPPSSKAVTRADLCQAVYQKVRLSRIEAARLVELVLEEITDCLEHGEAVKLSSFGSFVVRKRGQRVGRNPKTGEEAPIPPSRAVVFKPSPILKQQVNAGQILNRRWQWCLEVVHGTLSACACRAVEGRASKKSFHIAA
jgi:integration host factor subunit alpha